MLPTIRRKLALIVLMGLVRGWACYTIISQRARLAWAERRAVR